MTRIRINIYIYGKNNLQPDAPVNYFIYIYGKNIIQHAGRYYLYA